MQLVMEWFANQLGELNLSKGDQKKGQDEYIISFQVTQGLRDCRFVTKEFHTGAKLKCFY